MEGEGKILMEIRKACAVIQELSSEGGFRPTPPKKTPRLDPPHPPKTKHKKPKKKKRERGKFH